MIGLSSLAIIDKKGKSILSRNYRGDITTKFLSIYNQKILEHDEEKSPNLITTEDMSFYWVNYKNIRILAVTIGNANGMMIFSFLKSFVELLKEFLLKIEADTIRDNIIIIYELMDEIIDNGYPQSTDFKLMKKYIKTTATKPSFLKKKKATKKKKKS